MDTAERQTPRPHNTRIARGLARRGAALTLAALIAAACLWGCERDGADAVAEPAAEQAVAPPPPPPKPVDHVPAYMDTFAGRFDALIRTKLVEEAALKRIHAEVKQARAARYDDYHYRSILRKLYPGDGDVQKRLIFFQGDRLSEVGHQTFEILNGSAYHGLSTKRYHVPKIQKALDALAMVHIERDDDDRITLEPAHLELVEQTIRRDKLDVRDPATDLKLTQLLLDSNSPAPPLGAAIKRVRKSLKRPIEHVADAEAFLADAVSAYAWDMHYKNPIWFDPDGFDKMLEEDRNKRLTEIMRNDLGKDLRTKDIPTLMRDLVPTHGQYHKLLPSLARYRAIVDAGGWERLPATSSLRPGRRHKTVARLKRRLAIEGFYPSDGDPRKQDFSTEFDDALTEAIKAYQRVHQLEDTGSPNKHFWHSVRVSAKEKMELIEITIDRWRESKIANDDYYVFINIADFHAEVWKDKERMFRMKIIVGNTDKGCALHRNRWIRINATPIQSGAIENVIVNPWWSIPPRILKEEILPAAADNPDYFAEKGIQCISGNGSSCAKARMNTGEKNPLGRVKFIFPNPHNTFLHDTPHKRWFIFPRRAYSHGCMRLHKPMEFAELLLTEDGQWDPETWKKRMDRGVEYTFQLKKPVKIHIEYYTTRVDDAGNLHFLTDVYNHDRYRRRGTKFEPRKCRPDEIAAAKNPSGVP